MRRTAYCAAFLAGLWLGLFCPTIAQDDLRLEGTRALLRAYHSETLQSVYDPSTRSALEEIRDAQPASELLELQESRDEVVLTLGGAFWAEVLDRVGARPFMDPLTRTLKDPNPQWRAFACAALGSLGDPAAVPWLVPLLNDHTVVPGHAGDGTVAVAAAIAFADLGRPEGVNELLSFAEKIGEYWHLAYLKRFKALSGEDFGNDLDAWKAWFGRLE